MADDHLLHIIEKAALGEVKLPDHHHEKVRYVKLESQDPLVSDVNHPSVWHEQKTTHEKMGIGEEHGCIMDFIGTQEGMVGVTPQGEFLDDVEADMREEASGRNIQRFMKFGFRLTKLEKTDGPAQKAGLLRGEQQRRVDSESSMMDTISSAFQSAAQAGKTGPSLSELEIEPEEGGNILVDVDLDSISELKAER